ncbi:MAG: GvpL/GvpF family gas vesicle protein [Prolixibacteraceae bacterium]|jgi:hypothetical protein|nr:GvpL/GvpF family gas vesicle protein [Prolixibacteraceae bacterium]
MGKMIYAILSNTNSDKLNALLFGMKGISGENLITVTFNEISAVVSHIKREELIADQASAIAFAGIIENIGQHFTLLPMRYGSMLESAELIQKMLEKNYSEFQQNLQKVENQSEFGLKVFCDSEKLKDEMRLKSETDDNPSVKSDEGIKKSVYLDYMNKKLKEHHLEEKLLNYIDVVIAEFTEKLTQLNAVSKIKKRCTATILIDAVFLLKKEKKDELVQVVKDSQNKHPELNYTLTGPWPPYNFVDINLK